MPVPDKYKIHCQLSDLKWIKLEGGSEHKQVFSIRPEVHVPQSKLIEYVPVKVNDAVTGTS